MTPDFLSPALVQRLAFCLIHSTWQATLIALLAGATARSIPHKSSALRYAIFAAGMALVPIVSVATFLFYPQAGSILARFVRAADTPVFMTTGFATWTEWAVLLWLFGVAFCSMRLSLSWMLSRRLLRLADVAAPPAVAELFGNIRRALGIVRPVSLMLSRLTEVPVALGWLRPVVLLPVSALTGLDPDQLRAVLAHELAHIRRHDFAINLLQRCVEAILFYHPAVWWLSSRTRVEREHCCDDIAMTVCGDRLAYAQALLALEQARAGDSLLAVAATGGSLSLRIRRVLGKETTNPERLSAGVAGLVVSLWLLASVWQATDLTAQPVALTAPPQAAAEAAFLSAAMPATPAPETSKEEPPPVLTQLALLARGESQMPPQQQAGAIQGIVIKIGTGEPMSGTRVGLVTMDGKSTPYKSTSGPDGRFTISGISAGSYRLLATRSDSLTVEYGQRAPNTPGSSVIVNDGQTVPDLRLQMPTAGAISGRVLDQDGQPIGHARVQALRDVYQGSTRALVIVQSVQTNDLGEYRLFWLAPGSYFISSARQAPGVNRLQVYVQSPDDLGTHNESYPPLILRRVQPNGEVEEVVELPSYYPNVDDPRGASAVAVRSGDNIRAIDVRLAEPRPARRIAGRVVDGVNGQPFAGGRIRVNIADVGPYRTGGPLSSSNTNYGGAIDANGNFELKGIVPGSYTLLVTGAPPQIPAERHAHITVDVGEKDVANVAITVPASFPVTGRVVVDGPSNLDLSTVRVSITNILTNVTPTPQAPGPDGSFSFPQLAPADYEPSLRVPAASTLGLRLPVTHYLKAIQYGNVDVMKDGLHLDGPPQFPVVFVIGTNPGVITGVLKDTHGDPVSHGIVALVPNGTSAMREELYRVASTDSNGQFKVPAIRAGDYKLYGWVQVENGFWHDDNFLQKLQDHAIPVHVNEGSHVTLDVSAIPPGN